jgi:hypothetical protein
MTGSVNEQPPTEATLARQPALSSHRKATLDALRSLAPEDAQALVGPYRAPSAEQIHRLELSITTAETGAEPAQENELDQSWLQSAPDRNQNAGAFGAADDWN